MRQLFQPARQGGVVWLLPAPLAAQASELPQPLLDGVQVKIFPERFANGSVPKKILDRFFRIATEEELARNAG